MGGWECFEIYRGWWGYKRVVFYVVYLVVSVILVKNIEDLVFEIYGENYLRILDRIGIGRFSVFSRIESFVLGFCYLGV